VTAGEEDGMDGIYDRAAAYEIAFSYRDVPAEVDAVLALVGDAPASVLEVAAGPAAHAIECARRGMRAVALDRSAAMCDLAAANARRDGVDLEVVRRDMREPVPVPPVDLVLCMLSSVSCLETLEDMVRHLSAVRDVLTPSGRYLLENTHPSDYLGPPTVMSEWDRTRDGVTVHTRWGSADDVIDPVTQCTDVHVTMTVTGPDGARHEYASVERDRFWTPTEIRAAAAIAGLRVLGQYGAFDGRSLSATGAWRAITVLAR
jgi:SAM-dependent methyltransferase